MLKLSIVTVTYNNIKGLKRNIDSVMCQTFKDKEHIIVDNLSNDSTDLLVKDYIKNADYPVTYIRERDNGIYNAFNKGIKSAQGGWIHILNSDDYYNNNSNLAILLESDIKEFDILASAIIVRNEESGISNHPWIPEYVKNINHYNFPHPGLIIKKKFYKLNGYYNENFKIVSDAIFAIENFPKSKYFISEIPLVVMSDKGVSNKVSLSRTIEKIKCILFYYKFPVSYKIKSIYLNLIGDFRILLSNIKNRLVKSR
ncbi:MAG: glycosyltransferase [Candidatus Humimicrobiaceae bacterium]